MRLLVFLTAILAAPTAHADYPEAVRDVLTPGYAVLEEKAHALSAAAEKSCATSDLAPHWHATFDAWLTVSALRIGPVEEDGMGLAIYYWPDPKGLGAKAQRGLLSGSPDQLTPEAFAHHSVAARGLGGLERLLWPNTPFADDTCPLIRATARDLARMASVILDRWENDFSQVMLTAGEPGNTTFLTRAEVRQALFTQIIAALEFDRDQRLGRPLGTFEKPRPDLAEARASDRSLRNLVLSLTALRQLSESLSPDLPRTLAAFDHTIELASSLEDPVFDGVADPQARLKVEILQQAVMIIEGVARQELARELDVDLGFNAADGD